MSDRYAKYDKLKFDYPADRVLRITFDRPESFNSVDAETHTQMTDMWIDIDRDPDINAVIVTGAGKAFSAGGDFSLIEKMIGDSHEIMKTWKEAKDLVYNIINCNKPIIGRINGHAMGGGSGLVCACDIAVMSSTARIATPEVKIGLFPMMIMPQMMRVIPRRRLLEMYITGEPWSAEQALEYGIVNYVTEPDQLDAKVNELTSLITARSPSAVRLGKFSYHAMQDMTIEQQFRFAETMLPRIASTEDAREGFSAFIEKREPKWTGR